MNFLTYTIVTLTALFAATLAIGFAFGSGAAFGIGALLAAGFTILGIRLEL